MDKLEFLKIAEAVKTAYPKENLLSNKEAVQLWYSMLNDISYEQAAAAVKAYIALKAFPPSIADIREMALGEKGDWTEAWKDVRTAIRHYGSNRPTEALSSLDSVTRQAAECIGWSEICKSENLEVIRGQFRQVYEIKAKRNKEAHQLPPQLGAKIAQLTKGE